VLARLRKAQEDNESGFTLIELLVVMIIIGILAAIAIPVFLSQRAKAQDSAAKADVSTIGKEVATYYVDNTGAPVLAQGATTYTIGGNSIGNASANVTLDSGASFFTDSSAWCVSVHNTKGSQKDYKYSAAGGLATGTCANANG
jgi:prepilin-type N-terminal cleavage/methylation domain-containing protein